MLKTFITHLQIFGIGFSFGIVGPCFFLCTPILITYIAGSKRRWQEGLGDTLIFLLGRLLAYLLLGILAGLSGALLRRFTGSAIISIFKPLGGVVSIFLGIFVLAYRRSDACACPTTHSKVYNLGGLFVLGFIIGAVPCAPLLALLFEIALISKSALEGMSYALSFGLGTLLSGLIVVGTLGGILTGFLGKVLKTGSSNFIFRVACALLLMLLGLSLIFLEKAPAVHMPAV